MTRRSAALTEAVDQILRTHLTRQDKQEDLTFALYYPSRGEDRTTALVRDVILPVDGDREVHGNVEFYPPYFERVVARALDAGAGIAFLHSHPGANGWQGMSPDDIKAESGMAGGVEAATGHPLVGLTLSTTDTTWSARFWERGSQRRYMRLDCETVRVVGSGLRPSYNPKQAPPPLPVEELTRTIEAWGIKAQTDLARLRIGVVGAGSVGSVIAETLDRVGVGYVRILDFDRLQPHNRDRMLHATAEGARAQIPKVDVLGQSLPPSATARGFVVDARQLSVCEEAGYRAALDCDVLFSCVDRPWPRSVMNFIAYAHLVPVIDGGIAVYRFKDERMRGAEWRAHVVTADHRCLSCLMQYDPGLVAAERAGQLDDPSYIQELPPEDSLRANQNVFSFSVAAASLEFLKLILLVVRPAGISDVGPQFYHFPSSTVDFDGTVCESWCPYPGLVALGDHAGHPGTGIHAVAELARKPTAVDMNDRRMKLSAWIRKMLFGNSRGS